MDEMIDTALGLLFQYRWYVATVFTAYVYAMYSYWRLAREAARTPTLAPIAIKGGISAELGAREAGLILMSQLSAISDTFRRIRVGASSLYGGESTTEFREVFDLINAPLQLEACCYPSESPEYKVKEDLVVPVGSIEIPVGALWNLFFAMLQVLPVPYRKRYESSLIRLSLVSVGPQTELLIYRQGSQSRVLSRVVATETLSEISDLLRDAAFMILQLDGKVFVGRYWLSMRLFVDALDALDEFRRTARSRYFQKVRQCFSLAAETDPSNYEALYAHGSLLLMERTQLSIDKAVRVFTLALDTKNQHLRALVYAGLANCYAQQVHRLGHRDPDVRRQAETYAKKAEEEWRAAVGTGQGHALILAALALACHADEGTTDTRAEVKERFLRCIHWYFEAMDLDPNNWRYVNNLGWVLLKLSQWGVDKWASGEAIPTNFSGTPPVDAERCFLRALELNPGSKFTHANLCLLYATDWYRRKNAETYLIRCRHEGQKAIQLDPKYINGYRDLALSLARYKRFDEAYHLYVKALQFSETPEKYEEIKTDTVATLHEIGARSEEIERWRCATDATPTATVKSSAAAAGKSEKRSGTRMHSR
jgi:tetratricopeptide (TPR) repeat protein